MVTARHRAGPFSDWKQERESADLGMWVFLSTEILFFGVLFFGYLIMRLRFPTAFGAASRHTDLVLGTLNTAVLLTSSLTMALGVRAAALKWRRGAAGLLGATAAFGVAFLIIKAFEYHAEYLHHLVPGGGFHFDAPGG